MHKCENGCEQCCKFEGKEFLSEEEDLKIKGQVYLKTGIIYLYPFSRYTVSLTKEEKDRLEKLGAKILPKKIFYDVDNDKVYILDYFFDREGYCFFFDNGCKLKDEKPDMCKFKQEPNIDIKKITGHSNIRLLNMKYDDIQSLIKEKLHL
tara:strand:- start:168 stop:617 length:450 start_codon:yes stop_codon:yes gene_type:complete